MGLLQFFTFFSRTNIEGCNSEDMYFVFHTAWRSRISRTQLPLSFGIRDLSCSSIAFCGGWRRLCDGKEAGVGSRSTPIVGSGVNQGLTRAGLPCPCSRSVLHWDRGGVSTRYPREGFGPVQFLQKHHFIWLLNRYILFQYYCTTPVKKVMRNNKQHQIVTNNHRPM